MVQCVWQTHECTRACACTHTHTHTRVFCLSVPQTSFARSEFAFFPALSQVPRTVPAFCGFLILFPYDCSAFVVTRNPTRQAKYQLLSHVWLFATPWTTAHQTPLSGISQARILEWLAIAFCRGSSWPMDRTWVSCIAGRFFTIWATRGTLRGKKGLQKQALQETYLWEMVCCFSKNPHAWAFKEVACSRSHFPESS